MARLLPSSCGQGDFPPSAEGPLYGWCGLVSDNDSMTTTPGESGTFSSGESSSAARECEENRFTQSGGACRGSTPRGEVGVPSEAEAMLLDRHLPRYDVTETHAVVVDADTDGTWQAIRRSDLSRSAVIRVLLEMRSLPNRLQGFLKGRPPGPARPPLTLGDNAARRLSAPGRMARPRDRVRRCRATVEGGHRRPARAAGRRRPIRRVQHPWIRQGRLQHPGGALRQRARPHHH